MFIVVVGSIFGRGCCMGYHGLSISNPNACNYRLSSFRSGPIMKGNVNVPVVVFLTLGGSGHE